MNKFSVGDKVWHPQYGWGEILSCSIDTDTKPYQVRFKSLASIGRVWCGWWELFYKEVKLPNPPKPEPEIDWSKVPLGVVVQVRDSEDQEWAMKSFLCYDAHRELFWAANNDVQATAWRKCRIHPDVEIKKEWLK